VLFINKYSTIYKVLALVEPRHLVEGKTVLQKFGLLRRLAVNQSLPPEELTEILLNYKPHVLYGYTTQIDLLTLELIKKNIKPPGLKLVLLGGEIVHDHNRNLYVEAFGIDPIEYYGSEEMGIMAYETPARDGLHLCNDLTYFEFLDKNDNPVLPGEFAKVVVTDLLGTAMPIIRYDHGDIVTIKVNEDRDGNTEKRISKIFGRDNDYFILPDESTRTFCHLHDGVLREFDEIWQIRVIQKTKSSYQINIAASDDYFKKIEVRFKDLLYRTFSKDCSFDLFRVDSIEPDHSGKLRVLVSEIKDGYQANHLK
jgi:phenylacetate-CoA ligase